MYIDENDVRAPHERVPREDMNKYLFSEARAVQSDCRTGHTGRLDCRGMSADTQNCHGNCLLPGTPLAAVYAPVQIFRELYDHDRAFACGTLFRELDKPLEGRRRG